MHEVGEGEAVGHDLAIHLLHVLGVEGREACQHLVQQRSETPPVHCLSVPNIPLEKINKKDKEDKRG